MRVFFKCTIPLRNISMIMMHLSHLNLICFIQKTKWDPLPAMSDLIDRVSVSHIYINVHFYIATLTQSNAFIVLKSSSWPLISHSSVIQCNISEENWKAGTRYFGRPHSCCAGRHRRGAYLISYASIWNCTLYLKVYLNLFSHPHRLMKMSLRL